MKKITKNDNFSAWCYSNVVCMGDLQLFKFQNWMCQSNDFDISQDTNKSQWILLLYLLRRAFIKIVRCVFCEEKPNRWLEWVRIIDHWRELYHHVAASEVEPVIQRWNLENEKKFLLNMLKLKSQRRLKMAIHSIRDSWWFFRFNSFFAGVTILGCTMGSAITSNFQYFDLNKNRSIV